MPHTDESNRTVEGIVGVMQRNGRYLVIRRAEGIRAGGSWCFPGGAIEPGETQPQALVREMREELGVRCEPLAPCWEWEREDGLLRLFLWRTRMIDRQVRPDPAEVAEVRWATRRDILALPALLPSMREFFAQVDLT